MKICLLGASGYIGRQIETSAKARGHLVLPVGRKDCDLYRPASLQKFLDTLNADVLINCAGYTGKPNVDACELDKTNCLAGNAILPGVISEVCSDLGIPWGHVSSGCIYTGRRDDGAGFCETDLPNFSFRQNNCSFYSGTKALGEEILAGDSNCYIWRLRIPFSNADSPRNYLSKLLNYKTLLEAENSLSNLQDFAAACLDSFEKSIPTGIYNVTNEGPVMTSDVVALLKENGLVDKEIQFFQSEDQFMKIAAKTPRSNCVLDSTKAITAGLNLPPVQESLVQAMQNWSSKS